MIGMNKRALYSLAQSERSVDVQKVEFTGESFSSHRFETTELPLNSVEIKFLNHLPDARLTSSHRLTPAAPVKDAIEVSPRAKRSPQQSDVERRDVLAKLGVGALGYLADAYFQQQKMSREENYSVQQRFYGLQAV